MARHMEAQSYAHFQFRFHFADHFFFVISLEFNALTGSYQVPFAGTLLYLQLNHCCVYSIADGQKNLFIFIW